MDIQTSSDKILIQAHTSINIKNLDVTSQEHVHSTVITLEKMISYR